MQRVNRRRIVALVVPCALAMACDCGDTALLRPPQKDVTVQVHGGVSCEGERVQLRAIVYGGKPPFHYRWEPADGLDDPAAEAPTADPGTGREYTVTVIDSQSVEMTGRATVVRGAPPVPVLDFTKGADDTCAGDTVALDASRTVDHRGLAMKSYAWRVGDTLLHEGEDPTSGDLIPRDGDVLTLTVRDATGCEATVTKTFGVRALPRVEVNFAEGGPFVCAGKEVRLEAIATDADGNTAAHTEWDLDGDPNTIEATGTTSGRFAPGGARALFIARDDAGCTTRVETPMEVGPLPRPSLRFAQGAADVCEGARITLDGSASTDALGAPVAAFAWDLDGVPATVESTDAQPPQFLAVGTRDVRLTVTDARGCTADLTQHVRGRQLPLADIAFVEGRENVCRGDAVQVTAVGSRDADGQPVASIEWDMNVDGRTDNRDATPPAWTPTNSQLLRLTVKDAVGCTSTATQPVSPRALPTARIAFASGSAAICDGDSIALDGSTSTDADGNAPLVFSWDFDGDRTADEASGALTGSFRPTAAPVTLQVVDAQGCRAGTQQVVALKERPVADVAFVQGAERVCAGQTVQLDASASHDGSGLPIARLEWDLNGDPATVESTAWKTAAWSPSGTQQVALTVWGANGCTDRTALELRARPLPTARLAIVSGSADACLGEAVALSASESTDAEGNQLEHFTWDIADAPGIATTRATTPAFTPTSAQLARVTVRDAAGCTATATRQLTPRALPIARVRFTSGSDAICEGQQVALDASESRDADGALPASFAWDLDGVASSIESRTASTGAWRPTGAPAQLTIVDRFGCRATATQAIDVGGLPVARITQVEGSARVCAGQPVAFDASSSTTATGASITRYEWDFDGAPGADATTPRTPSFAPTGTQQVRLTVFDARGCGGTATTTTTAHALPTARIAFLEGGALVCSGATVALTAAGSTDAAGRPVARVAWTFHAGATTTDSTQVAPSPFAPTAPVNATLRVWDANDCSAEVSQAITARGLPHLNVTFVQGRANACLGDAFSLTAEASRDTDGNPLTGYAWDLDGDGLDDTRLGMTPAVPLDSARTVRLRGTDANGCTAERTLALAPRALPTADVDFLSGSAAVCVGDAVELTAAGSRDADGQPVASYAWNLNGSTRLTMTTGSFAPTATPAALTVTDAQGCKASTTQAFDVGALPTARIDFTQGAALVCAGQQVALDGSASRNAAGGTIARYEWDLDGNATTIESTAAAPAPLTVRGTGTARLTVVDGRGCKASTTRSFASRALPTARITYDQGRSNACLGDAIRLSGLTSTAVDGTPLASYAWDLDDDGTPDASGTSSGAFAPTSARTSRLTVTDAQGCTGTVTERLAPRALPRPAIAFVSGAASLCAGDGVELTAAGSRDADGQPVASYLWNIDGSTRTTAATGAFAPTGAPATLTVADAQGCRASTTQTFDVGALPTARIDFAQGGALVCSGRQVALDGSGSRTAAGGTIARYEWDLDGNTATLESTTATTAPLTVTGPRTARLTVFDGRGCKASTSRAFAARALPSAVIAVTEGRASACLGDALRLGGAGSRDADGNLVTSFAWDLNGDGTNDAAGESPPAFAPQGATLARLVVTDALGCSGASTLPLQPRALPTPAIAFVSGTAALCAGDAVELTAAGSRDADGQPVASYLWNIDGSTRTTGATGTFAPAGAPATLTVADDQGCRASTTQTFDVGALPTARIDFLQGGALVCAGQQVALDGSASTNASGAPVARYEWDLDGTAATIEATTAQPGAITPTGPRTVRLTVVDGRGCRAVAARSFAARALPSARITYEQGRADVCLGDAVSLSGATSADADGNVVSSYAWDLDANGSVDATSASSGGFTPATARAARLTVTDAMGCSGSATETIAPRALPRARINYALGDTTVCAGDVVQLDGVASADADGAAPQRFAWDLDTNGTIDETTAVTSAWPHTGARTATLRVTDRLGCTGTATATTNARALPTPRITFAQGSALVCPSASVGLDGSTSTDADGSAPATYAWDLDGNGTYEASATRPPAFALTTARTVSLRVSDALGCTAATTQALATRTPPVADAGADQRLCSGTSSTLGTTAVPGLRYAWTPAASLDDPTSATPRASPSAATTYALTVTDPDGCTGTDSVAVGLHPTPVATAGADRTMVAGTSVTLLGGASGGTPPYAYQWNNAATLNNASIAQPTASPTYHTTYELAVTDANACRSTDQVAVRLTSALAVNAGTDLSLCLDGGTSVPLTATATGGVGALRWQWTASPTCTGCIASPTSQTTTVSPTQPTTFTVRVTDETGANVTDSVSVTTRPSLSVSAGADRRLQRGDSTQLGTSPVAGVSYRWTCSQGTCGFSDPTASDPFVTPRGTTVYTVTATDGHTCSGQDSVLVSMEAQILAAMPSEGFDPWPRDAPLWVVFDTDLDAASLAGNVQLLDPADGRTVWIDVTYDAANRMLVVHPLSNCDTGCSGGQVAYGNNNNYLLVLKGGTSGIRTAGSLSQALYNDLTLEFNVSSMGDGTAPAIAHRRPAASATNVAPTTHVVVQFAEHVDPRTVKTSTFFIDGVASSVSYDIRTKTAYLRPETPLQPNRTYTVRVNGVVDARSSPTRVNQLTTSWTFTTGATADTTAPRALAFTPAAGSVAYDVGGPLTVRFDESLDLWTVGQLRLIDERTTLPVFADVLWDDATLTARIEPHGFLDPLANFRIEASDVTDHAGNRMAVVQNARFTTVRTLLLERFESGTTTGWALESGWGRDVQAAYASWYGLSDSPGANAPANASRSARTPALDVTGRTSVTLSYWGRRTIATDTDRAYVEYSPDGVAWTTAATLLGPTGWRAASHTLPTNGQTRMYVRFRHTTNASVNLDGWFLDEVVVR